MMPSRFAQRYLTKLTLSDIEEACGGGGMPLGERLLWKRSAIPLKISGLLENCSWRNIILPGDHVFFRRADLNRWLDDENSTFFGKQFVRAPCF